MASETSQLNLWGEKHDQKWKEFRVAREYVRSLKLNDESEWKEFVAKKEFGVLTYLQIRTRSIDI